MNKIRIFFNKFKRIRFRDSIKERYTELYRQGVLNLSDIIIIEQEDKRLSKLIEILNNKNKL